MKADLEARMAERLVRAQSLDGLTIYNYTELCQYERKWDAVTLRARGLVLDADGQIVANPFPKFFNVGEPSCPTLPDAPFRAYEKIDGSLGIWFHHGGRWRCATRGSLANIFIDYALTHAALLEPFPHNWTILTEIVMPPEQDQLRRAVDHEPGLYLLAIRETATGFDVWDLEPFAGDWAGHRVKSLNVETLAELQACAADLADAEGWVVRYADPRATRVKIKTAWYLRVWKVLCGLTSEKVADCMVEDPTGQWLLAFPEELQAEARQYEGDVIRRQLEREIDLQIDYQTLLRTYDGTRKDFALRVKDHPDRAYLFLLFDNRRDVARQQLLRRDPYVRTGTQ